VKGDPVTGRAREGEYEKKTCQRDGVPRRQSGREQFLPGSED